MNMSKKEIPFCTRPRLICSWRFHEREFIYFFSFSPFCFYLTFSSGGFGNALDPLGAFFENK